MKNKNALIIISLVIAIVLMAIGIKMKNKEGYTLENDDEIIAAVNECLGASFESGDSIFKKITQMKMFPIV